MEIKNTVLKRINPYHSTPTAKDSAVSGRARGSEDDAPSLVQSDRVSLSPSALLHKAVYTAASQAPDIRRHMVDGIKEQLADGQYAVDAKHIAKKLLESDALLASALNREDL